MLDIVICVCTRNRQDGLKRLLGSLMNMQAPNNAKVRIVVVENDSINHSEFIVQSFLLEGKFKINYYLETRQGLAYARNRSVKEAKNCDFCCFVDDDQEVAPDWLVELMNCQVEFDADGVWGQNPPIFLKKVPGFIKKFHQPRKHDYGEITESAPTNCLMLRKHYLDQVDGPFDLRLNFAGGEDTYLTSLITSIGGVIRFTPKANAYEIIPNDRTTISYLIIRTYRDSNSSYLVDLMVDPNLNKLLVIIHLCIRFTRGVLILIPYFIFSKSNRLKGLIKMIDAIGGLAFFLGFQTKFYQGNNNSKQVNSVRN